MEGIESAAKWHRHWLEQRAYLQEYRPTQECSCCAAAYATLVTWRFAIPEGKCGVCVGGGGRLRNRLKLCRPPLVSSGNRGCQSSPGSRSCLTFIQQQHQSGLQKNQLWAWSTPAYRKGTIFTLPPSSSSSRTMRAVCYLRYRTLMCEVLCEAVNSNSQHHTPTSSGCFSITT